MTYRVKFPSPSIEKKFNKFLLKIPQKKIQDDIMESVESLSVNPRPFGEKPFKKLKPPIQFYQFSAQYRIRIADYRVLYDIGPTCLALNCKTKAETVIADYSMFRGGVANRGDERVTIVLMGITPMMILNAHQDKIYCGMNESYTINVFDANGKKTLTFSLKRDRKRLPNKQSETGSADLPGGSRPT